MGELSEERSVCVPETGGGEVVTAVLCIKTVPHHHEEQQTKVDSIDRETQRAGGAL